MVELGLQTLVHLQKLSAAGSLPQSSAELWHALARAGFYRFLHEGLSSDPVAKALVSSSPSLSSALSALTSAFLQHQSAAWFVPLKTVAVLVLKQPSSCEIDRADRKARKTRKAARKASGLSRVLPVEDDATFDADDDAAAALREEDSSDVEVADAKLESEPSYVRLRQDAHAVALLDCLAPELEQAHCVLHRSSSSDFTDNQWDFGVLLLSKHVLDSPDVRS